MAALLEIFFYFEHLWQGVKGPFMLMKLCCQLGKLKLGWFIVLLFVLFIAPLVFGMHTLCKCIALSK